MCVAGMPLWGGIDQPPIDRLTAVTSLTRSSLPLSPLWEQPIIIWFSCDFSSSVSLRFLECAFSFSTLLLSLPSAPSGKLANTFLSSVFLTTSSPAHPPLSALCWHLFMFRNSRGRWPAIPASGQHPLRSSDTATYCSSAPVTTPPRCQYR